MKRIVIIALGMIVLALVASGCMTQPAEPAPVSTTQTVPPGSPIVGAWVLESMTSAGAPVALLPGTTISATFTGVGLLSGSDGCNQYSGSFTLSGSQIQVSPTLASTMMACEPAVMDQAQAYTRILIGQSSWMVSGDKLTIQDTATGKNILVYGKPVPPTTTMAPAPSPVGSWDLTAMTIVKDGSSVVQNPSGTIYAVFDKDGTVAGSGGCNQFSGTYTTTGSTIAVKDVITTLMSCGNQLDTQERAFLMTLEDVSTFENTGTGLTMTTRSTPPGKLVFAAGTAVATPVPPALVGNWGLTKMTKNGVAITPVSGVQPTALFTADGAISGLASCNQYSGGYVLTGSSAIGIGPLATTRMMCPTDVMTQETSYLGILEKAATWEVPAATGALTITDSTSSKNTLVYKKITQ
jgi:heat shock protein HslJ